jgi:hypothetical protein
MSTERDKANTPQMDWQQVALNGRPPCFALLDDEDGWYCGRAERWEGHDGEHKFIPLADALANARAEAWEHAIGLVAVIPTKGTMNFRRGYEEGVRDALRTLEVATLERKAEGNLK